MSELLKRITGHSARQAGLLALQVILGGALFALLLLVAERHNRRFDLTPTQSFVLSDEAERVAGGIQKPIRITVFYNTQEHGQRQQMEDLLHLFSDASPLITYRLLDLDRSPALAKKYGIGSFNTGVMETEGDTRMLSGVDEGEITNALLKLTRHAKRTLCFFTGHGEHSPLDAADRTGYSEVGKALEKDNFEIRTLDAVPPTGVPQGCTVVILAGPVRDFLAGEATELASYLGGGGRLLLMVDPNASPSVVEFLAGYGVRAGNDIIVDERNRFYGADSFMPRVPIFDEETYRNNLDTAAVFSLARTVSPMDTEGNGRRVLELARTSPESFAHVDGGAVPDGTVKFDRDKDRPGPLPVAVMVIDKPAAPATDGVQLDDTKRGRMIVFGDSDFASNLYLNLLGNKDFFMSTIGVLAEDEELIAIRRKGLPHGSLSPVSLTARQGRLIFWVAVIIAPTGFAFLGIMMSWRRRRRADV